SSIASTSASRLSSWLHLLSIPRIAFWILSFFLFEQYCPQGPIHPPTPPRATTCCPPCSHAVEPSPGGGAGPRPVVARGGRVERWGPCGCQAPRHAARCTLAPQLSGKEGLCPCTPKSVGERGISS